MTRRTTITAAAVTGALALVGAAATTAYATVPATFTSTTVTWTTPLGTNSCTSTSGAGTLLNSPASASPDGTIASLTFTGCLQPVTGNMPWQVATTGGGPFIWDGELLDVSVRMGTAPSCTFNVEGTAETSYDLAAQELSVTSSAMVITNVTGCFGLVHNGDPASVAGTFDVS